MTAEYRKKPVVVQALRLAKPGEDNQRVADLFDFLSGAEWEIGAAGIHIKTLEGEMRADPGDWIIRGVAGEFYPCKPDIFAATYDPAEAADHDADAAEIVRLAEDLTKAQQEALTWKGTHIGVVASNAQLADRLIGKGLAVRTPGYNSGCMLDWTEVGLAVRAILQSRARAASDLSDGEG